MARTALIEALIDAPEIVDVSPRTKTVALTIRAELRNVSDQDYVLHRRPDNDEHFWHLLDQNHREIMREQPRKTGRTSRKKDAMHLMPMHSQTIAGGHSSHENQTLKFDASKLKDGQTYTIRMEIWGQIAEASFTVVRPQKSPVKKTTPAKKKAPPKKTAKKTTK